jgi:hypothetical protein
MPEGSSEILVILETGAEWPGRYAAGDPGSVEAHVISQYTDESLQDFGLRVAEEVTRMESEGTMPSLVIVACSDRTDAGALGVRRGMGRAVLSTFAHLGAGSLLFAESQRKSGSSRQALSDLATDLEHEFEDEPVQVSVRFGQASRPPIESVIP